MSDTTGYVGWHRPNKRSPWRPVVESPTEAEAFEQLLDSIAGGDNTILPAGVDPNSTEAAPRRRRL